MLEFMSDHHYTAEVRRLGIPDKFIEHGSPAQQYEYCGFSDNNIADIVREMMKEKVQVRVG